MLTRFKIYIDGDGSSPAGLWPRVLVKAAAVSLLLICLWALKNKDAVVVYLQF